MTFKEFKKYKTDNTDGKLLSNTWYKKHGMLTKFPNPTKDKKVAIKYGISKATKFSKKFKQIHGKYPLVTIANHYGGKYVAKGLKDRGIPTELVSPSEYIKLMTNKKYKKD